jgi:hypothetical protein
MKRDAMSSILIAVVLLALGVIAEAQARTAADPSDDVAGIDPGQEITGLAASVLTRPSAVRGTDGRFHIAYELVLTGATRFAVDVERVEVRDAKTHRVLLSLAGPELLSRMNPVGDTPAGVPPDRPAPPPSATLLAPSGSAVIWLDVLVQGKADLPAVLEHLVVSSTRPPRARNPYGFQAWSVASRCGPKSRWSWARPWAAAYG